MNTNAFDMVLLGTLSPGYLYDQCKETGPNKIAEKYISKRAWASCYYAIDVLKGRFELGEEAIATDAYYSYLYAIDILKGRFELGETVVKNSFYKEDYENHFNVKL